MIPAKSQDSLSYAAQLEILESELDSLSIFNLIDSLLLSSEFYSNRSELNLKVGYTSSITSSGRDFGINQSGYSSGITYYHKSGFYGDLSGYWNNGVTPSYNPTILNLGYLVNSKKLNYSFDYEHWFYNPQDSSENPLTNSIGASATYDINKLSVGLDYSYLFGKNSAHRFIGNVGLNIGIKPFWKFNQISFFPTANVIYGNSELTTMRITVDQLPESELNYTERLIQFSELSRLEIARLLRRLERSFTNGNISESQYQRILSTIEIGSNLSDSEIAELNTILQDGGIQREDYYEEETFGLLNYSFSFPIILSTKKLSFLFNFTYSIPVKLPGEIFEVQPIGYFSTSIIYR